MQFCELDRENFPPAHAVHEAARLLEYLPPVQAVQAVAALSAPVLEPAGQAMHSSRTALGANLPVVHHSQLLWLNTYVPPGHLSQLVLSVFENFPER